MDKRFFALLVSLLLSIGFETFAQDRITAIIPSKDASHSPSKFYVLRATKGAGTEDFYVVVENNHLILKPVNSVPITSYIDVQKILWRVKTQRNAENPSEEGVYIFNDAVKNRLLAASRTEATSDIEIPGIDANLMGGDIYRWIPSSSATTPGVGNFFYIYNQVNDNKIIVLTADKDNRVLPRIYPNFITAKNAMESANSDIIVITTCSVEGLVPLTANDLNTSLNQTGGGERGAELLTATKESSFTLHSEPAGIVNPFASGSYQLQAQGVRVIEDSRNHLAQDETFRMDDAFKDTTQYWMALHSIYRNREGFVVVDTAYNSGTDAVAINAIVEDVWYHNTNRKRLLDSYLFRFLYDPNTDYISIVSKAYISAPVGRFWDKNVVIAAEPTVIAKNNYLVYKSPAVNGLYTYAFDNKGTRVVSLINHGNRTYEETAVPDGLYTLQVIGSEDQARIGKYAKISPHHTLEFVERPATYQQPSAQWMIESLHNNQAKVINREFPALEAALSYFGGGDYTTTYSAKEPSSFFFIDGDTLRYILVPNDIKSDKKIGYKYFENVGMNRYSFNDSRQPSLYWGEESGDVTLWLKGANYKTNFAIEYFLTEKYSYTSYKLPDVPALERSAYYLSVNRNNEKLYVSYHADADGKRYYLQKDFAKASSFFLKETARVGNTEYGEPYYTFLNFAVDHITRMYVNTRFMVLVNGEVEESEFADAAFFITPAGLQGDTGGSANEIAEATKTVITGKAGTVTVKGAAGKKAVVSTVLGRTLAKRILSEEDVFAAPAGIVIVAVEGEKAAKVLVK
ncbi:hypothetical protein Barb7_00964 [Bacteroidales bacterium Barb7]|nr:hypothetical protein Barb7_00964 [Bacteroidales bacterium Barb7]